MNIHDLEAFVAVVETGSIVGASTRLHLTQPGVTRRVQNLEEALSTPLLDRQSKPLKPTAAGRETYERGRRVLRSLEDLRASVTPDGDGSGELRLGVMSYLSEAALSRPLDRLRAAFPGLSLRIATGWTPRLLEQAARSELDAVAVCLADGAHPPEELGGEELGLQRVLLVAARRLGVPQPATLADLARFPWVMNETGCGFRATIRQRFEAAHLALNVAIEAPSAALRLSLVARGLGIGIITPMALANSGFTDPAREDRVEIIEVDDFRPQARTWLLHRPPIGRLARPLQVFGEGLREALASPDALAS
jgi:DNA-binding transcriptional LysR family regulator